MLSELKFTQEQLAGKRVSDLPDRPSEAGMTAAQLKAAFDRLGEGEIALGRVNELIDGLASELAAAEIGAAKVASGDTSQANVQAKLAYLNKRINEIITGEGFVESVNKILPDEYGNVLLTAADIDDGVVVSVNEKQPDEYGNVSLTAADIGEGFVVSVNEKPPDENGNVLITTADISAIPTSAKGVADGVVLYDPNGDVRLLKDIYTSDGVKINPGPVLNFTPKISGVNVGGSFTYATQVGRAMVANGRCYADIHIAISAILTAPAGELMISNFPVARNTGDAVTYSAAKIFLIQGAPKTNGQIPTFGITSGTNMRAFLLDATSLAWISYNSASINNTFSVHLSVDYPI